MLKKENRNFYEPKGVSWCFWVNVLLLIFFSRFLLLLLEPRKSCKFAKRQEPYEVDGTSLQMDVRRSEVCSSGRNSLLNSAIKSLLQQQTAFQAAQQEQQKKTSWAARKVSGADVLLVQKLQSTCHSWWWWIRLSVKFSFLSI